MTLLWSKRAETNLQAHLAERDRQATDRLVRRLVLLENDASTFVAMYDPIELAPTSEEAQVGPLLGHVIEAEPGTVFVILFRLVLDAEDVWVVELRHGR